MSFATLQEIEQKHGLIFDKCDTNIHTKIIDIFNGKLLKDNDLSDMNLLNIMGNYYEICNNNKKAEHFYLMSVELGCSDAMFDLGDFYENKRNNKNKAIEFYLKAIEKNNHDAMNNLGKIYENNNDYVIAEKYYIQSANLNNTYAIINLIQFYKDINKNINKKKIYKCDETINSDGFIKYDETTNSNNIIKYYLKYIELEPTNTNIICDLGDYYFSQKMMNEATDIYNKAIELKNNNALHKLAMVYKNINNIPQMIELLLKSIEFNNGTSMVELGIYYESIKNNIKAEELYLKAIEYDKQNAATHLTIFYLRQNNDKALSYENMCDNKNKNLLYSFGKYYTDKDNNIFAKDYFDELSPNDFDDDMILYNIGKFYHKYFSSLDIASRVSVLSRPNELNGFWMNNYDTRSIMFYEKSMKLKNYDAMAQLGMFYYSIKQTNKAVKILTDAIELNNSLAMAYYAYYCEQNKWYDVAEQYYLRSIELNCCTGYINYAMYTYKIKKNFDKSLELLIKSILLNNKKGLTVLKTITKSVQLFVLLNNIENKNDIINNELTILRNDVKINNYLNKINFSTKYKIIEECSICYETKLNVCIGNCMHLACELCYNKLEDKCPLCNNK